MVYATAITIFIPRLMIRYMLKFYAHNLTSAKICQNLTLKHFSLSFYNFLAYIDHYLS